MKMRGLMDVYCDAAMRALVLHGAELGLTTADDLAPSLERLKPIVLEDYSELVETLKGAAFMGEPMMKHTLNVYANNAAVRALKGESGESQSLPIALEQNC
jgi:hypothetical protein